MTDTQTTVGVVRESGAGERRVALVPKAVASLVNSGVGGGRRVRRRGGRAAARRPLYRGRRDDRRRVVGRRGGQGRAADGRGGGPAAQRADADRLPGPAQRRQPDRRAEDGRGAGVRAGGDPADLPRAGDGRAVVAGQRRRLQGGAAGGVGVDPVLPDADHRRGHGEAGQRAGARRRCRRPAGAGHGQAARGPHHRLRRASRGRRPGPLGRRAVARPRHRRRR